jgi:hypothetical protein
MLNYSNNHRKDPAIRSNALKCGLTLFTVFVLAIILNKYYKEIGYGLGVFFSALAYGLETAFVSTVEFLKPVLNSVGYYIMLIAVFLSLWAPCVFFKVKDDCLESSRQWLKNVCIVHTVSFLYLGMYYMHTKNMNDEYAHVYNIIPCFIPFVLLLVIVEHSRRKEENTAVN